MDDGFVMLVKSLHSFEWASISGQLVEAAK